MRTRNIVVILLLALGLVGSATFACSQHFQERGQHYQKVAAAGEAKAQKAKQEAAKLQAEAQELQRQRAVAEQKLKEEEKLKAEEAERQKKYEQQVAERREKAAKAEAERMKKVEVNLQEIPFEKKGKTICIPPPADYKPTPKAEIMKILAERGLHHEYGPHMPIVTEEPFPLQPVQGPIEGEIHQIAPLSDGGLAMATEKGAYILDSSGKMQSMGTGGRWGNECYAVAVSPTGEVALAFRVWKTKKVTRHMRGREPEAWNTSEMDLEIHIIRGKNPRVIGWYGSISRLAYNANGSMLAAVGSSKLLLIKDDKVWQHPGEQATVYLSHTLQFHPAAADQLVCCNHRLRLQGGTATQSWVGWNSLFGPEGDLVTVRMDYDNLFPKIHDGDRGERMWDHRMHGADRIAVGKNYVAYTRLHEVLVWDRKSQQLIHRFQTNPPPDGSWLLGYVKSMAFQGDFLLVANRREVTTWDPATGKQVAVVVPAPKTLVALLFAAGWRGLK